MYMMKIILPKFCFKIEKWKWNKEYRVYVSSLGNFKDEHKKPIPFKTNSNGYLNIKTPYGYKLAHRLVMLTFCPIPNAEELTVDHKNHNKRCNELSNLEWVTEEENHKRAQKDFLSEKKVPLIPIDKARAYASAELKMFSNIEEAVNFVIKTHNMENAHRKRIRNRIKNSIANDTLYCGRKWREYIG